MRDEETERQYTNGQVTVVWKPKQCMHSGICFAGLGKVFNPKRRPWVDLSQATTEQIVAQVNECPSGALSLLGTTESGVTAERIVEVSPNGPLLVYGNVTVKRPDGQTSTHHKVTAFCRCGQSGNKPFCDGTHKKVGFQG